MVYGPAFLSLTACCGLQVSESSKGPGRRIGISDARVEILRFIVMVQRSGKESRGTATDSVIFFSVAFCLNSVNALRLVLQYTTCESQWLVATYAL